LDALVDGGEVREREMSGAKYRPTSLGGETQYYNVLFTKEQLDKVKKFADDARITRAMVVRLAVDDYLERKMKKKNPYQTDASFYRKG